MDKCTEVHSGGQGLVSMQTKPILSHGHVRSDEPMSPFTRQGGPGLGQRRETATSQPETRIERPGTCPKSEGRWSEA